MIGLVGAPLGNAADASARLRTELAGADIVAAEDTRRVRWLASSLNIELKSRVVSYYDAVEARRTAELLGELQARNADLTESLEQQTATSEILRVISSSPTDVQPVFDAVAESAARLCDSLDAAVFRRDGDLTHLVAHHGPIPPPTTVPVIRGTVNGRTILDASGGAAVSCLGHGDERVVAAAAEQMRQVSYCSSFYYTTAVLEQLCDLLVASTGGEMARAYIVSSGGLRVVPSYNARLR